MKTDQSRLWLLTDVLHYTSEYGDGKTALLSVGEKICINQERAYLLNQRNPEELRTIREYKVPEHIENKIQNIVKLLNQ